MDLYLEIYNRPDNLCRIYDFLETNNVNFITANNSYGIPTGQTCLMAAVGHGRLDLVNLLLDAHADVNLVNSRQTPISTPSSLKINSEICKRLIEAGVETPILCNCFYNVADHLTIKANKDDAFYSELARHFTTHKREVVKTFLLINNVKEFGLPTELLLLIFNYTSFQQPQDPQIKVFAAVKNFKYSQSYKIIEKYNIPQLTIRDVQGNTLLMHLVQYVKSDVLEQFTFQLLLNNDYYCDVFDINAKNYTDHNALYYAITSCQETTDWLLAHGAILTFRNVIDAIYHKIDVTDYLHQVDINHVDPTLGSIADKAIHHLNSKYIEKLIHLGFTFTSEHLRQCLDNENSELCALLIASSILEPIDIDIAQKHMLYQEDMIQLIVHLLKRPEFQRVPIVAYALTRKRFALVQQIVDAKVEFMKYDSAGVHVSIIALRYGQLMLSYKLR